MYYVIGSDGAVAGPYDAEQIGCWLAEGRIGSASLVSGGSMPHWVPLAEHPELAPLAAPGPAPAAPAAPGPGPTPAGHAPAPAPVAAPAAERPGPARPRPRPRVLALVGAALAALLALVVVAFALAPLAPSGRWSLAPDVAASWFRGPGGATPHPLAPTRSDAPAVDVTPMAGIRIQAPAGALDKQRTFTARPLDAKAMVSADETLRSQGLVLLGGYDLDAGMAEEDRFLEPATVTWDLEELGIPKPLWGQVAVANLSAHGRVDIVASEQRGSNLVFKTSHNGSWLPVLVPALMGAGYALWVKDQADVPKGDFTYVYWSPGNRRFRVMYPRSWPSRDPVAVKAAEDEYLRIIKKHKLMPADVKAANAAAAKPTAPSLDPFSDLRKFGDQLNARIDKLKKLAEDPEYIALVEKVKSDEFFIDAFLPVRAGNTVIALDRGYEYLDERGFRKPGVAKFATITDVYIVGTSMGADLYGEARNGFTTSPFIVIDGTKIPDAPLASMTPEQKMEFDSLQLTAMHELFHIVQSAYVFLDRNKYLWFAEAAAVTLEGESKQWYLKEKQYAKTWDMTASSYEAFFDAMEFFDDNDAKPNQAHGYGESNFFVFLRDSYFTLSGGKKTFLPTLYEDFSRLRGGAVESLYRVTGGTPKSLSDAFYAFSYAHRDDLLAAYTGLPDGNKKKPVATIDAQHRVHVWRFAEKTEPLSAQILQVKLAGAGAASKPADAPVFALSTNGAEGFGAITRAEAAKGVSAWDEVRGGAVLNPAKPSQHLMRVETYVTPPAELTGAGSARDSQGPIVFGMFKDTAPPTVDVKEQVVRISWKPSQTAQLVNSAGKRQLISHYRVTITTPDGRQTAFSADEADIELPVAMLDKLVAASGQANRNKLFKTLHSIGQADMVTLMNISEALTGAGRPKLAVSYQEVAAIPGSPRGPMSAVATFEIGDEARMAGDVTGTWIGRVPFSEGEMMRLDLQQEMGGDFIGTMRYGGESIPLQGAWQPATSGWQLEMRDSHVWAPMFMLAPGYAQKLPADKIYLAAPPALLTRVDKKAPDLGWSREPEDMQWQDFLNMLGRDIEAFNNEMEQRSGDKP